MRKAVKKSNAKQGSLGFDGFEDVVLRPLGLACGRNVPHKVWNFEKAQEFCKHCLKGHPGGSLENHNADRNMTVETWFTRFQRRTKTLLENELEAVCDVLW